jgi:hypothetical protein
MVPRRSRRRKPDIQDPERLIALAPGLSLQAPVVS